MSVDKNECTYWEICKRYEEKYSLLLDLLYLDGYLREYIFLVLWLNLGSFIDYRTVCNLKIRNLEFENGSTFTGKITFIERTEREIVIYLGREDTERVNDYLNNGGFVYNIGNQDEYLIKRNRGKNDATKPMGGDTLKLYINRYIGSQRPYVSLYRNFTVTNTVLCNMHTSIYGKNCISRVEVYVNKTTCTLLVYNNTTERFIGCPLKDLKTANEGLGADRVVAEYNRCS